MTDNEQSPGKARRGTGAFEVHGTETGRIPVGSRVNFVKDEPEANVYLPNHEVTVVVLLDNRGGVAETDVLIGDVPLLKARYVFAASYLIRNAAPLTPVSEDLVWAWLEENDQLLHVSRHVLP